MAAAPNGASIFPFAVPTQPIPSEFLMDAYVQLLELIATQCAAGTNGTIVTPTLTVFDSQFTIQDNVDPTKQVMFQLANSTTGVTRTLSTPDATGTLALIAPAPIAVGASTTLTAAQSSSPILLNTAAGSTATLPAATGSGNKYQFFVTTTTTSGAHKILAASVSDFIVGIATGNTNSTGVLKGFQSAAATNHSLQMPFAGSQPSGGFIGDWFELTDVAANLWEAKGMFGAGTTATTVFSSATT